MNWRLSISAFLLLLISCAPNKEGVYAAIDYIQPANAPPYNHVSLRLPTGRLGCSAHGFGPFREVAWVSIRLPEKPVGKVRFEVAQITLEDGNSTPDNQIVLTGGYIAIDLVNGKVEIAFTTTKGAYWANGTYPALDRSG